MKQRLIPLGLDVGRKAVWNSYPRLYSPSRLQIFHRWVLVTLQLSEDMSDCKARVPTADARKAGIASDDTLRILRTPIATGRVNCIHCVYVRLIFKMSSRPLRSLWS